MRRVIFAILFSFLGMNYALATSTLTCKNQQDTAYIELTIGFAAVESIVKLYIEADGHYFSSAGVNNNAAIEIVTPITIAQSYVEQDKIEIVVGDLILEKIIATIRLNRAIEGDEQAIAGTLRVNNIGVYSVICSYS